MNLEANNELNRGSGLREVREAVILPMEANYFKIRCIADCLKTFENEGESLKSLGLLCTISAA